MPAELCGIHRWHGAKHCETNRQFYANFCVQWSQKGAFSNVSGRYNTIWCVPSLILAFRRAASRPGVVNELLIGCPTEIRPDFCPPAVLNLRGQRI